MNNYFIITNLNGNDLGEYGWIVEHDSEKHLNEGDMIEAAEYFSGTGSTALVHRKDLLQITEEQYHELSELISKGEDNTDLLQSIIGPL